MYKKAMAEEGVDVEQDMQYLAEELTRNCTEFVELTKNIDKLKSQIKGMNARHKELSTKITSLMKVTELDEVNCGTDHKILLQERKSTTGFKIENISAVLVDSLEINEEQLTTIMNSIKQTRVTTFKDTIKLKKN